MRTATEPAGAALHLLSRPTQHTSLGVAPQLDQRGQGQGQRVEPGHLGRLERPGAFQHQHTHHLGGAAQWQAQHRRRAAGLGIAALRAGHPRGVVGIGRPVQALALVKRLMHGLRGQRDSLSALIKPGRMRYRQHPHRLAPGQPQLHLRAIELTPQPVDQGQARLAQAGLAQQGQHRVEQLAALGDVAGVGG